MIIAKLELTMTETGQFAIVGSIDNKLIAYGLLELGKEAVNEHHKQKEHKIQPAGLSAVAQFAKPNGG